MNIKIYFSTVILLALLSSCNQKNSVDDTKAKKNDELKEIVNSTSSHLKLYNINNQGTYVLDESNLDDMMNDIYDELGAYLYYYDDEDSIKKINAKLNINVESLDGIREKLSDEKFDELLDVLNFSPIIEYQFTKKDAGKYYFKLNPDFWQDTYNGNSYLGMLMDHNRDSMVKFRPLDSEFECYAHFLLIMDTQSSINARLCESFSVLMNKNTTLKLDSREKNIIKKEQDGYCSTRMFKVDGYNMQSNSFYNDFIDYSIAEKDKINEYISIFEKLKINPIIIKKIVMTDS